MNFPETFVWFQESDGEATDPYELLKQYAVELFGTKATTLSEENLLIAEGGAAAMAYARLQFENLNHEERLNIENALLRYCELDTLAMVMILKAWMDWA